jgi:hypothetical protein
VEYVNKRIGGVVQKLSADSGIVKECNVILSVSKNPKVCYKTTMCDSLSLFKGRNRHVD